MMKARPIQEVNGLHFFWINKCSADVRDQIDYYYLDSLNSATGTAVETANAYGFLPVPDVEDLEQDIPLFYPDEPCTREFAAYTAVQCNGL